MDFTDLNDNSREAELDHREVLSLLKFYNFQRERNGEPQIVSDYEHVFDRLEEVYPDLAFRCIDYKVYATVKAGCKGSLVEKIGFVSRFIPHLSTSVTFDAAVINVIFRADSIGIIKEESWYEFFEHDLDLGQVRRDCRNGLEMINDYLHDYFRSETARLMEDPFFDPATEGHELYFERGSREELDRLMRLFILTEPWIEKHVDDRVCLFAELEGNKPYLEENHAYCSKRLKQLTRIALSENRPMGWTYQYNDGAHFRRSGYDQHPMNLTWEIGEVLEQVSARKKMAARRELQAYLKARGCDIARFDAMAKRKRTGKPAAVSAIHTK
jgi:hypothetical protein